VDKLIAVHPIERLRYVARGGWAGPSLLGAEAAWALADLASTEPAAVVPACRRLLDRQPSCGPLWWVAARVLDAADPVSEATCCAEALEDDATAQLVVDELPEGARVVHRGGVGEVASADIVLVEADALGPTGMFVESSCERLLASAKALEVPVWVETGVGRVLPPRIWDALTRRVRVSTHSGSAGGRDRDLDGSHGATALVDLIGVQMVIGPRGARRLEVALEECDCPEPPQLVEDVRTSAGGVVF